MDGKVTAVVGTHTHVQTADEKILSGGTAYISDVGMTGPSNSVIGIEIDQIIERFLTNMPMRFETGKVKVSFPLSSSRPMKKQASPPQYKDSSLNTRKASPQP